MSLERLTKKAPIIDTSPERKTPSKYVSGSSSLILRSVIYDGASMAFILSLFSAFAKAQNVNVCFISSWEEMANSYPSSGSNYNYGQIVIYLLSCNSSRLLNSTYSTISSVCASELVGYNYTSYKKCSGIDKNETGTYTVESYLNGVGCSIEFSQMFPLSTFSPCVRDAIEANTLNTKMPETEAESFFNTGNILMLTGGAIFSIMTLLGIILYFARRAMPVAAQRSRDPDERSFIILNTLSLEQGGYSTQANSYGANAETNSSAIAALQGQEQQQLRR